MKFLQKRYAGIPGWVLTILGAIIFFWLLFIGLFGIGVTGFMNRVVTTSKSMPMGGGAELGMPAMRSNRTTEQVITPSPPYYDDVDVSNPDRKQVYSAFFSAEVKDVPSAVQETTAYVDSVGGLVTSSSMNKSNESYRASLSFRVPKEKFMEATQKIRELALEIESENVSMRDETGQATNISEQLDQLYNQLAEYEAMLEEAETTADELRIQRQIDQLNQRIENLESQRQRLSDRAEMSTIQVSYRSHRFRLPVVGGVDINKPISNALGALMGVLLLLAQLLIWVVVFIPLWLPIVLIVRHKRKAAKKKKK